MGQSATSSMTTKSEDTLWAKVPHQESIPRVMTLLGQSATSIKHPLGQSAKAIESQAMSNLLVKSHDIECSFLLLLLCDHMSVFTNCPTRAHTFIFPLFLFVFPPSLSLFLFLLVSDVLSCVHVHCHECHASLPAYKPLLAKVGPPQASQSLNQSHGCKARSKRKARST